MVRVLWPTCGDFIPPSLTYASFDDIKVDLDTSKHYIQVYFICVCLAICTVGSRHCLGIAETTMLATCSLIVM